MRYIWLNKKENNKFILFFNGWGMDENAISHLKNDNYDILAVNDYRDFDFDLSQFDFSKYKEKYFIAWSMGVYVAGKFADIINDFNKKIAISGTGKIIDNNFGIPNKIYNYTVKFFNDEIKEKFINNIFLDEKRNFKIEKSTASLKDELIAIQNLEINFAVNYDRAIIAKKDSIVPYKNQLNFWKTTNAELVEADCPHYVFNNFTSWGDIIC